MSECNCKKDKCLSPAVLQINNQDCPTVFHKVTFPAAMGDDKTNPPRNGQYRNVLLVYEANGHVYMFSSDGIPTLISDGAGTTNYNRLSNKPSIEGHELAGDSSLEDIGVTDAIEDALEDYTPTSEFAEVAFTGDYDDLIGTPTIPVVNDATLTVTRNGTSAGTFTANSANNTTIDISVPTATSDLTNDSGFITNTVNNLVNYYTKSESDAAFVPQTRMVNSRALSSDITLTASDVGALPDSTVIPTVNDATLTIQRNGTNVQTFTANASSNVTADISVPTKTSDLTNDGSDNTAQYLETDETAYRTTSIPYGECDSTSTSTVFTATVPGITELRDGVCMLLKNGVVTSASGFTININGLGAKPAYSNMGATTRETTVFNINYTMLFVYDSDRVEGGCWVLYRGYFSDANSVGYQIRTNNSTLPALQTGYRYRLWLTSVDGQNYVPINTDAGTATTSTKSLNTTPIDPFGAIVYNSTNGSTTAGASLPATTQWTQYTFDLRYAKYPLTTLTFPDPVYLQCTPQSTGGVVMNDIVQTLPTTEDGKIYIYLGNAYSTVSMELKQYHPVYYFKDGAIRLWTNPAATGGGGPTVVQTTGQSTTDVMSQKAVTDELALKADSSSLATVATSGSYNDLSDKPTIPTVNDATLTITQNGTSAGTFTANASSNTTINLTDTTYSDFSGATSSVAGASGLVPAPTAGDEDKALKGDGTWSVVGDVVELFVNRQPNSLSTPFNIYKDSNRTVPITHSEMRELFIPSNKKTVVLHEMTSFDSVYPVIMFCYDTNDFWIFDAVYSSIYSIESAPGGGSTDFAITRTDLQKKLTAGSNITISGDTISASAELVEMSYGESNAWAKFIAAYNAHSIVYCRASSNANPATGSQTRKAFMAYVNSAESPTSVEFQYVRSVSSKTASQPVDQVFVYTLTSANGGTWTVTTRNMGPKLAAGTNTTVSYSNGTYTISATGGGGGGPTVVQTVGTSTTSVMSQNAVTGLIYYDPSTRGTISIGTTNGYEVTGGIQIGDGALAPEDYSIAIGYNARGSDGGYPYKGIAIGANAYVFNEGGVAIGADTNVQSGHSVAIGDKSYVGSLGNEYVVSVGRPSNVSNPFTRRIINVTDPIDAQDAATKNYVDTVVGNIETILQTLNSGNGAQQ